MTEPRWPVGADRSAEYLRFQVVARTGELIGPDPGAMVRIVCC